jgi:hypothetical protein
LDDKNILTAHILMDFDKHFHIREAPDGSIGQRNTASGGYSFGQWAVAVAGNNLHAGGTPRGGNDLRRTDT